MKRGQLALAGAVIVVVALVLIGFGVGPDEEERLAPAPAPVLSVVVTRAHESMLPIRVPATGNVAAWQEASVGAEVDGLRLTDVMVNVGDVVRRGQVLAVFNADTVGAELSEARAAVAQAGAEAAEAQANFRRAEDLDVSGAMSSQEVSRYAAAAKMARARLDAAQAVEKRNRVRLAHTRVLAPSNGVITSRTATVGAVVPAGQELFRMIKDGRLEWRAVVSAGDLDKLEPGQLARIDLQNHEPIEGELRMVAPAIDTETHSGLVYVDLPRGSPIRAGAFVDGYIEVGNGRAVTLPQSAVLLRDGFHYVMGIGPKSTVVAKKVVVGRRVDDRIEITEGLSASEAVVASGLSFLSEGDTVRVVQGAGDLDTHRPAASGSAKSEAVAQTRSEP